MEQELSEEHQIAYGDFEGVLKRLQVAFLSANYALRVGEHIDGDFWTSELCALYGHFVAVLLVSCSALYVCRSLARSRCSSNCP